VGIRVLDALAVPEPAARRERLLDLRIGVEHALAAEELHGFEEVASRSDRRVDLETVLHAGEEVVGPVTGRRVDGAGALLERHVVAEHGQRVALIERVTECEPFHDRTRELRDGRAQGASRRLRHALGQGLGDDHDAAIDRIRAVRVFRVKGDREVRRDRPRSGRPDQHRHVAARQLGHPLRERCRARP